MWKGEPVHIVAKIEWKMVSMNGDLIWVDTVTGKGSEPAGNRKTTTEQTQKRVNKLMEDLFINSYEAIKSSPEIRSFAQTR